MHARAWKLLVRSGRRSNSVTADRCAQIIPAGKERKMPPSPLVRGDLISHLEYTHREAAADGVKRGL
jgi:hypothetical protein